MANGFAMVGVQADIEAKQLSRMRGIALHTTFKWSSLNELCSNRRNKPTTSH